MTTDISHSVSPSTSADDRHEARARVQRSLEALQRTHIPVHSGKVLGMVASLHRILGSINANQTLNEGRVLDTGSYDAGFAAALLLVEEQITSEIR